MIVRHQAKIYVFDSLCFFDPDTDPNPERLREESAISAVLRYFDVDDRLKICHKVTKNKYNGML
jgi:hypothetical protein